MDDKLTLKTVKFMPLENLYIYGITGATLKLYFEKLKLKTFTAK